MSDKQILRILDDLSPSDLKLKDLPRRAEGLHNMFFNEYGQLVKRKGFAIYNARIGETSHKITGLHRFYRRNTLTKGFLAAWDTKWYLIAETTPWAGVALLSKAATDFATTTDMDTYWTDFGDRTYGVNSVGIWKYDGTYNEIVGITPPAAAPTGTSPGGGSLSTGNYKVKYTYVDTDGFESNGSPESDNIACTVDDMITLAIVVSPDPKVASRKIYRTSVGGSTFYYDKAVANNTDITVDLTQADSVLIVNTELHTNHDVPPTTPHLITKRRSRLMLAEDENTICSEMSSVGEEYFPPSLYFPSGNGQKVTGMMEQLHTLPVFTDDSLERLTNFDAKDYEFKNAFSNEGCVAPRSLCSCKNILVYLGFDGIYYFNGTAGRKLSYKLSKYIMKNINATYAKLSCGVYYEDKYLLTYAKGASTVPNETVYYDFETQTTGVYNLGFSCYSVWDKGGDTYSLKAGSNTIGQVYSVFSGLTDNTAAIACYDDVEPIDLGMPDTYKKFYGIYIKIKSTDATTLTMNYDLDYGIEVTNITNVITADTTKWYFVGFGSNGLRARALGFRPSFSDRFACEIHGYELVYSIEPAKWRK